MPHSLALSSSTDSTFNLDFGPIPVELDSRPKSIGGESQRTQRASSSYGVALTSTASQDERTALPSQQLPDASRRRSVAAPESADDYSSSWETNLHDLLRQRGPGDRNSVQSTAYNDTSKRRSQYFEEQSQYKDGAMSQAKEKVVRQSPVIAELKTNVIVSVERGLRSSG